MCFSIVLRGTRNALHCWIFRRLVRRSFAQIPKVNSATTNTTNSDPQTRACISASDAPPAFRLPFSFLEGSCLITSKTSSASFNAFWSPSSFVGDPVTLRKHPCKNGCVHTSRRCGGNRNHSNEKIPLLRVQAYIWSCENRMLQWQENLRREAYQRLCA